ncbi:MAG: universal stress protein [Halohasta sp.]
MSLEKVLVAVETDENDDIDDLAETVVDIAGPAGATVVLADVFSTEAYENARDRLKFDPNAEVTPSVVAERKVRSRAVAEMLADAGIEYTVEGRLKNGGSEGDRLADLAEEIDADLVIIGGRGRTPAGKAVFGSTVQRVLLSAPCPVTFVRSE